MSDGWKAMGDVRDTIRAAIARTDRYGVNDQYSTGYMDGLAFALCRITEAEYRANGEASGNHTEGADRWA